MFLLSLLPSRRFVQSLVALFLLLPPALVTGAQSPSQSSSLAEGQRLFSSTCAACHGLDGHGGEHAPNIAAGSHAQSLSGATLLAILSKGIPAAGMPGFEQTFSRNQLGSILTYLKSLQVQPSQPTLGDAVKGRAVFFQEDRCSQCHMVSGQGGFLARDLSGYGKTHSAESIREWIVHPNKSADELPGSVVAVTKDGSKYLGVVRNEDNFSLQMQTADGVFHSFQKSELTRIEHPVDSMMPADYGSKLTSSQLQDLVSFLVSAPGTLPAQAASQ